MHAAPLAPRMHPSRGACPTAPHTHTASDDAILALDFPKNASTHTTVIRNSAGVKSDHQRQTERANRVFETCLHDSFYVFKLQCVYFARNDDVCIELCGNWHILI